MSLASIRCAPPNSGVPIIRTHADYVQVLKQAEELSKPPLIQFENQVQLSEAEQKDLGRSADLFQGLVEFDPTRYANYLALGKISQALGQDDKALAYFQQALDLKPVDAYEIDMTLLAECAGSIATIELDRGRLKFAKEAAQTAIDLQPKSADYYALMARVLIEEKHIDEAQAFLNQALKLNPNHALARDLLQLIRMSEEPKTNPTQPR